jgi:UDP-GlcNAc:undecaprenyl-phosphate GlcNAc-1-phosphate transferase
MLSPHGRVAASTLPYVAATFGSAMLGMADDRYSLSATSRIVLTMLIFGSVALLYPQFNVRVLTFDFPAFELGLGTLGLSVLFTTVCCVGLVNAVNMADGKNGLVIGLCLGWLTILALRAPPQVLPLIGLLAAGLAALFLFNLRGHLFLGDGGSYGFATAIALLTIYIYNVPGSHEGRGVTADEIVLLFMVPVFDSFRLTFVRMRRGQSPMAPDCDHLHHHLQARFGWPLGLVIYLMMALLPAGAYILLRP